jgi:hypothetical protein
MKNLFSFLGKSLIGKEITNSLLKSPSFHNFVVKTEIARKSNFFQEFKNQIIKEVKNVFFSSGQKRK